MGLVVHYGPTGGLRWRPETHGRAVGSFLGKGQKADSDSEILRILRHPKLAPVHVVGGNTVASVDSTVRKLVGFQIFAAVNPVTHVYAGFSVIRDLKTNEWRKATAADIKRWNETRRLVIADIKKRKPKSGD